MVHRSVLYVKQVFGRYEHFVEGKIRHLGEQEMNLAKEFNYATKSAEAALERLDRQWDRKLAEVRKEIATLREKTQQEDQCNSKSAIHLYNALEKTQNSKRESITGCEAEIKEISEQVADLENQIRESKKKVRDASKEEKLMEQFKLLFESEFQQAQKEALYRRNSKKAAVKIQSAWRGVMVRKALGPYKYLKKKRKRGKKSLKKK